MRAILTYHSIDASGSPVSCHPEAFTRHLAWFASGRVRVTTIDELMTLPADADAVAITFDDGFTNFGEVAAPRLLERGLPVVVFVVADLVGTTNRWDSHPGRTTPGLPLLDWPALIRLQAQGVTIGAHSRTHPDLTAIGGAALDRELRGSADEIERRCGRRPTVFAYPYGRTDPSSTRAAAREFRWACTTEFRTLDTTVSPAALPRLDMYYFQRPDSLNGWGTRRFDTTIKFRQRVRKARQTFRAFMSESGVQR